MNKQPKQAVATHVRWMILRDMPEVLTIERQSFDSPWTEAELVRILREKNCIGMVAERDDRIDGYMVYEIYKTYLSLMNFAVSQFHRRDGVGSSMVAKLKNKIALTRRTRITLDVRESNLTGQLFFRHHGFKAIGVARNRYIDLDEDAYVMQWRKSPEHLRQEQPVAIKEKTKDDIRREQKNLVMSMVGKAKKSLTPDEYGKLLVELVNEINELRARG